MQQGGIPQPRGCQASSICSIQRPSTHFRNRACSTLSALRPAAGGTGKQAAGEHRTTEARRQGFDSPTPKQRDQRPHDTPANALGWLNIPHKYRCGPSLCCAILPPLPPLHTAVSPTAPLQVVSKHSAVPPAQGLFNPENDKDSCGVGFVAGAPLLAALPLHYRLRMRFLPWKQRCSGAQAAAAFHGVHCLPLRHFRHLLPAAVSPATIWGANFVPHPHPHTQSCPRSLNARL